MFNLLSIRIANLLNVGSAYISLTLTSTPNLDCIIADNFIASKESPPILKKL